MHKRLQKGGKDISAWNNAIGKSQGKQDGINSLEKSRPQFLYCGKNVTCAVKSTSSIAKS